MPNQPAAVDSAPTEIQADLRQLGCFTGPSLTTDNHHLMGAQGVFNNLALARYRQLLRKANF